jgi:lysophospholipase L1-like esterase
MRLSMGLMVTILLMAGSVATAQTRPATRPAARGRGSISSSPRDKLPFTDSNLAAINPNLPTLFITGDSTAATGDPDHRGWAAILVDYFDTSKVNLVNRGIGGARFNSYLTAYWPAVMAAVKPGDFVVIEFGHNSGPLAGIGEETAEVPGRGGATTTMHTHGWYLRKFIADVRERKGIPIASTLTLRNYWKDGKVERLKDLTPPTGSGMSEWTRQVAAAEKVFLVDHSNIIADRYDAMGKDAVAKFFAGAEYLHTDTDGAIVNCEALIAGLKAIPDMPLVNFLNDKGKAIEPYKPGAAN